MAESLVVRGGLKVAQELDTLIEQQIAPGTGVDVGAFWAGFEDCLNKLGPVNRELLLARDQFQTQIDQWHLDRSVVAIDASEYKKFLYEIGYLLFCYCELF